MRQTALIVDGDSDSRHLLSSALAAAGIDSIHAAPGAAVWQQLDHAPDIIILDLSLPDGDGLDLLRQLRQTSDLPVLIHATGSDESQRITGIELGADDFLPKSCTMRELLARVRGLLRRTRRSAPTPRSEPRRLHFGEWTLDTATRQLTRPDNASPTLGGPGYALLLAFLEHPFEPLSREHLSRVLNREYMPYDRIIDVHVSQIRRALGQQADGSSFIRTLRSQGYVFVAEVASST
ncbi:response regulator transcription factor [Dechloromonas sp. XY25]|uniref:Response regulator transcription factor n=1 Tax=Dechloromonas hankyongensis TaxID=2908002 RepID=A0ABS9K0M5_9RHOO|nr:response regulator transcription factor [Dechloromonas hankyongensis]MCG2576654.1 response regulator transcription factor [Dechloromonas hankyongensis]